VGSYAFNECTGLLQASLNPGLTNVSAFMFAGCRNLSEVNFPESLTAIEANAFWNTRLGRVVLPQSLASLGEGAFMDCIALTNVVLPPAIHTMGAGAFSRCSALPTISIPAGLATIENYAFAECSALTNVTLANGLLRVGESAFQGCAALPAIILPDSVTN
jgi:hypothetical protein